MTETEPEERKSNAGRKPYDALLKFKNRGAAVAAQSLWTSSRVPDPRPLSFIRFLDLEIEDPVPDATTIWLFLRRLAGGRTDRQAVRALRPASGGRGLIARGGQIIDATIVSVPSSATRRRERGDQAGKTPEGWSSGRQECAEGKDARMDEEE